MVLKKILNFVNVFLLLHNHLPLEKDVTLHLNKLASLSPKDALWQVWLKMAQWFWRRRRKCEKFMKTTTTTTTDNGQILIRKSHLSLRLRWAEKCSLMRFSPTLTGSNFVMHIEIDYNSCINTFKNTCHRTINVVRYSSFPNDG